MQKMIKLSLNIQKMNNAIKTQHFYKNGDFSANDSYNLAKFKTDFKHAAFVAAARMDVNGILAPKPISKAEFACWLRTQTKYQFDFEGK